MPATRSRRIVRRTTIVLAACVLLPVWYVMAWLTVSRIEHDGLISDATARRVRPAFVPLLAYCDSRHRIGSVTLGSIWWSVNPPEFEEYPLLGVPSLKNSVLSPPQSGTACAVIDAEWEAYRRRSDPNASSSGLRF